MTDLKKCSKCGVEYPATIEHLLNRKVKRVKLKGLVSCGEGTVLPRNPVRPECIIEANMFGVMIYNPKTKEHLLTPWNNIVEIIYAEEPPEPPQAIKRKKTKKDTA